MPNITSRFRLSVALATAAALLAFAPSALAASLTVTRAPAPPAAVLNDGSHSLSYSYNLTFTTTPELVCTQITDPSGNPVAGSTVGTTLAPTTTSPYSATGSYLVPAGLAPGRYLVDVAYYSVQLSGVVTSCPANLATDLTNESLVQAQFDVAASVGTITVNKFEDVNGDGIRQATEPLVPNFEFSITAPNPDFVGSTTYTETTDASGSFTLTGVPAGPLADYTVSEILPNPNTLAWAPTTGSGSQTFALASGADTTLLFGNARLTSLCGTVYNDVARSGGFAAGQPGVTGVVVTLGGADGRAVAVAAGDSQTTDASGNYCFTNLYPGTYSVSEGAPPAGLLVETDIDGNANGANFIHPITVSSGQPSVGNNFLLVAPAPVVVTPIVTPKPKPKPKPIVKPKPKPTPKTKLCISKTVNHPSVKQGQSVIWTVTVKDCGRHNAYRVVTTDPLLTGLTLGSTGGAKLIRGQLVWATGTLKRGQSRTYSFATRFDLTATTGAHVNHANAVASNAGRVNAQATTTVLLLPRPPVVVPVTG